MSAALGEILPTDEYHQLQDCERIIEEGYNTFLKVGLALAKVRDARLYRASHDTFEAYCESRWAISRTRAYELIGSAGITEALSAMADIPAPTNERQARELHGLDPETAAEVMASAVDESGNLTAAAIREARQEIAPKPAHITTTTRTTEATKVEHDVDLETGEITSPDSAPAVTGEVPPLADSGPAPGVEPEQESGALDLTQQRDTGAVYDLLREIAITVVMQGEHASGDASFSYDGIEVEVDDSACHIWVCGESKSRQVWVCLPIRLERSGTPGLAEALKSRGVIA